MNVVVSRRAASDLSDARDWYRAIHPDLGERFRRQIDEGIRQLMAFPRASPAVYRGVRRLVLLTFPYSVFYQLREATAQVVILRVLHHRRRPPREVR